MLETIEVRYKPLGPGLVFHKYIVYTDSNGNQYAARGGPKGGDSFSSDANPHNNGELGPIVTAVGIYQGDQEDANGNITQQGFIDHDKNDTDPRETIATGSNLSSAWDAIVEAMSDIQDEGYEYGPAAQNSNAVVDEALDRAGLPLPQEDGIGENYSPGSGFPLFIPYDLFKPVADWLLAARDAWFDAQDQASPLVLDLDGDGVELTAFNAATTTTFFDIDNDGFAEQSAWVGSDDGLLVRDLDGNGTIDNAGELFGSATVDGFAILAPLDTNGDHVVNQYDTGWNTLNVWKDADGDAVTDTGELHTLASLNIKSFDLAGVAASTDVVSGNPISHTSTYTLTNGTTRTIADAWFVHDNANSSYNGDFTFDVEALFLPTLRGFGTLPDLHIAMSMDSELKGMVKQLATGFTFASFADPVSLDSDIADILYRWAGVQNVSPTSRGINVDAQHLEFLERLFGQNYLQGLGNTDPAVYAGKIVENAWHDVFETLKAHLLIQAGADTLFANIVQYSPSAGDIVGSLELSEAGIDALIAQAPATETPARAFWVSIVNFIDHTTGITNLTVSEQGWLDDAVTATTTLDWAGMVDLYSLSNPGLSYSGGSGADSYTGGTGDDLMYGNDGDDTLHGGAGADTIEGMGGNDTLYGDGGDDLINDNVGDNIIHGGDGNDTLNASVGNDELHGNAGGNFLNGYTGNDIYVFGGGDDVITDLDGTDKIKFAAGITLSDLTFTRMSTGGSTTYFDDLFIDVADGGSIQINSHYSASSYTVEQIEFSDSTTYSLTGLMTPFMLTDGDDSLSPGGTSGYTVYGLKGNDYIQSGSGNDILDGGVGNDILNGREGNDTYVASPGFDFLSDSGGSDTIEIAAPYTMSDVTVYRIEGTSGGISNLTVMIDGLGEIQVRDNFIGTDNCIEYLHFLSTSTTVDLTTLSIDTLGTSGDDYLSGTTAGASPNDILDGRAGNDRMDGGTGNDTYYFSIGSDEISESNGTDTIKFRASTNFESLTFANSGTLDFTITEAVTGDTIKVLNQRDGTGTSLVEKATMDDSFTVDLTTFSSWLYVTANYNGDNNNAAGVNLVDTIIDNNTGHTLRGYDLDDVIAGMGGNDIIFGDAGNDQIRGGDGTDTLNGGAGNDLIIGGAGTDTLTYSDATAAVTASLALATAQATGGSGSDIIIGIENLTGSAFADTLTGDAAANVLDGGNGNDTIQGGAGNDTLTGNGGTDTVTYAAAAGGVTVNLATATAQNTVNAGTDTLATFENLTGSAFGDTLTGSTAANVINGGAGNDIIEGGAGNDTLTGGANTDLLSYLNSSAAVTVNLATATAQNTVGAGTDTISGFENLTGSAFNDTLTGDGNANTIQGGAGNDTLNGAGGTDILTYINAAAAVTVNLATLTAQNTVGAGTDTISAFEHLTGSAFNDTLTGDGNANTMQGLAGNDTMNGGNGTDTVTYIDAASAVTVSLALATAQNTIGAGTDTLSAFENLTGSNYNDTLTGSTAANTINGGAGDDLLYGGAGNDTLTGGVGADDFMFQTGGGSDTVTDFSKVLGDALDLSSLLTAYDPLTHAITDFVQITDSGANSLVKVDVNGTTGGTAWTQIASLTGITSLTDEAALIASGHLVA